MTSFQKYRVFYTVDWRTISNHTQYIIDIYIGMYRDVCTYLFGLMEKRHQLFVKSQILYMYVLHKCRLNLNDLFMVYVNSFFHSEELIYFFNAKKKLIERFFQKWTWFWIMKLCNALKNVQWKFSSLLWCVVYITIVVIIWKYIGQGKYIM